MSATSIAPAPEQPVVTDAAEEQLSRFLAKYDPAIEACAREVRARLRALLPSALELVYDNYNALAIGFGPTERASEAILSIALMPRWVLLYFLQGARLADPHGLLQGSGKQGRHIRLQSPADLELEPVRELIAQAVALSFPPIDPSKAPRLIIKSVSEKQRARRPR